MAKAKAGDRVRVHYTGTFEDGVVFDSSENRSPLEFTLGNKEVIDGFDTAVIDLETGAETEVNIPAESAYGDYREEMVLEVPLAHFPEDLTPVSGMALQLSGPDGRPVPVVVKEVRETTAILDANHPLAGKTLNFKIKLMEILEA